MIVRLLTVISLLSFYSQILIAGPSVTDNHIKVDQFGYRCNDEKIAVISNPQAGFNAGSPFTPGTGTNQYEVRNWSDDAVVFSGTLAVWNSGSTHTQSGDKVWWFDFSSYTTPGTYYIYDVARNVGSYKFQIRDDIYKEALKHAVRSYYYQRCGTPKLSAYGDPRWADVACHVGTQQDTDCRLYNNTNVSTSKDLSGGWHDAGDYNKYVNFAWGAVSDLALAYLENPSIWTDDYNIPESGNGIPDILDELKYELDWLLKMQNSNGSVISIVGGGSGSPPSSDGNYRRYGPATTSASISAASMFAQGAIVFKSLGIPAMTTYANTLQTASINAWNWASANTTVKFYNSSNGLAAGEQEFGAGNYAYDTLVRKLAAASYLYNLTGNTVYKTYFESKYTGANMTKNSGAYCYPFESTEQDAILYYTNATGATAAVVSNIRNKYSTSLQFSSEHLPSFTNKVDAYRAYLHDNNIGWGSNSTKCKMGNMFLSQNYYNLNTANADNYTNAASGYLHYMHGINPLAIMYVSNMDPFGAEYSVREFYHSWFTDGSSLWDRLWSSTYGPAPGFVPGGPNPGWSVDGCCPGSCGSSYNNDKCNFSPSPGGQPILKSFLDWNTGWPQNSWEVAENAIYYNSPYVRLLSKFISSTATCGTSLPADIEGRVGNVMNVNVFPNPFNHHTILEVISPFQEKVQIRILSPLGKELMGTKYCYTNEPVELGHEVGEGLLILEIKNKDTISTFKLIKN